MFSLPEVRGKYSVGATTFAIPITAYGDASRVIGRARLKPNISGVPDTPALKLEEVVFTAYYPADMQAVKRARKGVYWVPRPVSETLKGYAQFGGMNALLVHGLLGGYARVLKIPVYANVPLLGTQSGKHQWPLVIFSHGLGGTRTTYSHFCARLAAEGRVVLAIEHRDGTGPFVFTHTPIPGLKEQLPSNCKLYIHPEDVTFDKEPTEKEQLAFREEQLLFRRIELYLTYTLFSGMVSTPWDEENMTLDWIHTVSGPWNHSLADRPEDRAFWKSWHKTGSQPRVQYDYDVLLTGHSFGGATVLSVLSNPPPSLEDREFSAIPVRRAVALDPWLEPLPSPGPAPHSVEVSLKEQQPSAEPPALLVLNSEQFSLWTDHFARLRDVVRAWDRVARERAPETRWCERHAWLVTLVRARHTSFSDFGVIVPFGGYAKDGRRFLDIVCELTEAFLKGDDLEDALDRQSQVEWKVETVQGSKKRGEERRLVGEVGDVVVN
ncbi:uncharacterized protein PHACADRAFT_192245 [Phanerochaete carnosa HHB-10118-sp]|uniref:1-alkyl-2-acetylglycerophosphocholine esterase n=1 Tax=Phanerochaete carnosa (strain HHB-10118-sp) TaxID=650164 RepID=K5WL28_PHACS|nr:uncharacterized protein PHACADRAFT_192245 [Phanerochaete carnosa HHB-10118-sp]EKM59854.1 hypothetical protein PHACADRAFT_192245 [Phanerochaete carnosa HHB-10118-sp]